MRIFRRIALITAALILVVMSYRVFGVYQIRSGECTPRPPRTFDATFPDRLRVMSYNIEGHASLLRKSHIEEIAATIRKYEPDVVAINEAHRHTWQARFGDHIEALRLLTGMNVTFGRSFRFAGGDFGNAILTRGEIVSTEVHKLPGVGEPRTLLESIVRVNGGTIQLYVTHVAAWASLGRGAREQQLQCIQNHVRASGHPFLLAGDLNAGTEAAEISRFLSHGPLQMTGDPAEATHRLMGQRLDYILAGPGWRVVSAQVLDDGPSDHRPVLTELTHP